MGLLQTANAHPPESLQSDLNRLTDRLAGLHVLLDDLADTIHGPVPAEVNRGDNPVPQNIAAYVRYIGDMIGRCENAASRIQSGL